MTGYLHPKYAESLAEFGDPCELLLCGGWILVRRISGTPYNDAMGCYPLFTCRDWSQLPSDLERLEHELVSLALVADPFGEYSESLLRRAFPDVVVPFKEHFVAELNRPVPEIVSKHHRYYARKARQDVHVESCEDPSEHLADWVALYSHLIKRHDISGIQAFSREAFAKQLEVPGLVMLRAVVQDETVGMHLWFVQDQVAQSHLAAFSPLGYELMASYALYWFALEYFTDRVQWLNFGGGAGVKSDSQDGLSRFKRGWATGTRPAFFCGRVLDRARYTELIRTRDIPPTDYFPTYRLGEF